MPSTGISIVVSCQTLSLFPDFLLLPLFCFLGCILGSMVHPRLSSFVLLEGSTDKMARHMQTLFFYLL